MRGAVLITGAGRGIGRSTALLLAQRERPLVLVSKSEAALRETARLCRAYVPTREIVLDVTDPKQVGELASELRDVELDVVVNNAGMGEWAPIEELSLMSWTMQIDTNLRGPFLIVRQTLPCFKRKRRGLYVNVGSDCSLVGMPGRAAYNASKFGLVGLSVSMRCELAGHNIHTAIVFAGKTDTWFRGHSPGDRPGALYSHDVAHAIGFVIDQYPGVAIGEISVFPAGSGFDGVRSFL